MAKKKELTADFNFSLGFLKQLGDSTLQLMDRDSVEFADRGFTPAKRTDFIAAKTAFANFPTDEQLNGIKISATAAKDKVRENVERQMRTIFMDARNVFGENTGAFREFGKPDLTHQTDSDLVRNAKAIVATATKYLTNLAPEGMTAAKIAQLEADRVTFDSAIDAQKEAITDRDNSTETRIGLANTLYHLIVKYSDTGKDIWASVSEAKYKDYVIFNTTSGGPETPPPPTP